MEQHFILMCQGTSVPGSCQCVGLDTIKDNRYCFESGTQVCLAFVTMRIQLIALGLVHKDCHTVTEYIIINRNDIYSL